MFEPSENEVKQKKKKRKEKTMIRRTFMDCYSFMHCIDKTRVLNRMEKFEIVFLNQSKTKIGKRK